MDLEEALIKQEETIILLTQACKDYQRACEIYKGVIECYSIVVHELDKKIKEFEGASNET